MSPFRWLLRCTTRGPLAGAPILGRPWRGPLDGGYGSLVAPSLAAWLVQALGGRWRPRATWIDRAGRALGVFFIAAKFALDWIRGWGS